MHSIYSIWTCCLRKLVMHPVEISSGHPPNPFQPQWCWLYNLTSLEEAEEKRSFSSGIAKVACYNHCIITVVKVTEIGSNVLAASSSCCLSYTELQQLALLQGLCVSSFPGRMTGSQAWTVKGAPLAETRPWLALHGHGNCYGSLLPSVEWLLFVCMCVCACLPACDRMSREATETEKELLILISFQHIRGPSIFFDDQLQSLLPPTVFAATLTASYWPWI